MRVRILARPTEMLAGISPEHFDVGGIYDIRAHVACVYLARGWAEPGADEPVTAVPLAPDVPVHVHAAVFVFEDAPALHRFAAQLLTYRGYRVVEARYGEEAIEHLRQQYRAVMVLDVMTPIARGCRFRVDVVYLTHTHVAAIPVMLRADEDEAEACAARVDAIAVCKIPFDPDALLEALA